MPLSIRRGDRAVAPRTSPRGRRWGGRAWPAVTREQDVVWWAIVATLAGCRTKGAPVLCEPPGTQVENPRAAGCVAVRDGRILMVQSTDGRWSIPAGFVEAGEDSAAAAVRETLEEASVKVTAGPPFCATKSRFVAHRCSFEGPPKPRGDGKETLDAELLTADDLRKLPDVALRFPEQREAYLRAIDEEP